MINQFFQKHKSIIAYLFFGVCTTAINVLTYSLFYYTVKLSNIVSVIIAWILAVLFAFITNKLFVFDSKSFDKNILYHEITSFVSCRLSTGVLDVVVMYISVDLLSLNPTVWKITSNIFVIILNYIASKLFIFRRPETKKPKVMK